MPRNKTVTDSIPNVRQSEATRHAAIQNNPLPMLTGTFIDPEKEIASPDFPHVESFLNHTGRSQIGWHYIVDLTWMMQRFRRWQPGITVLDAGGGFGPVQFLLAEMGFDVVNIDLTLKPPPGAYRFRYRCRFKQLPSHASTPYADKLIPNAKKNRRPTNPGERLGFFRSVLSPSTWAYARACKKWRLHNGMTSRVGKITWIAGNLCDMPETPDKTFDAVVSLSALEHIPKNCLDAAIDEIKRVAKPGAEWAVTTSGTGSEKDWFHDPSKGWCFSIESLKRHFQCRFALENDPSAMLERYRHCSYLKDHLADVYRTSADNGMPWGEWNPAYIPVGIDGWTGKD